MTKYYLIGSRLIVSAAMLGWCVAPTLSWSQTYPVKPIRIVVGFSAGGGADLVARMVAQKLNVAFGQPVVVENRPGAGGNIAHEYVARAPADGYTLLAANTAFAINPSLYTKVPYDPVKDFEAVSGMSSFMLFMVVHPSLPVRSVKDLIALAKAKPGTINYASGGAGTATHMAAELFSYMSGTSMMHIPYKGSAPQLTATISGEAAVAFSSNTVLPLVQIKKLALLGVTGSKRYPSFPNTPTISEAGVPGYEVTGWTALLAPSGTPVSIIKRLNDDTVKGLRQPDVSPKLEAQGIQEWATSPQELTDYIQSEIKKWAKVVEVAKIERQ
ncbi:MAG: tripartite tricarboxylate transporter substrate binding protein [Burkholderiales bacterium]